MSSQVSVSLPDGSTRTLPSPCTLADVAANIGPGLARNAVAGKINGQITDLSTELRGGEKIEIVVGTSADGLEVIRHSTAHLMAMAIQDVFPGTQITIGPVVENQFYYDVKPPEGVKISSNDFEAIEKKMQEIVAKDFKVQPKVVSRDEATKHFLGIGEKFKAEIVQDIPADQAIKIYEMGGWGDLCRGPHVPSTGKLGAFKLMSIAGAYWRANKDNDQLTRIYGTAWANKKDLDAYLHMLEEAKKRDHVLLGKQLELFTLIPESAVGAPFFLPNGAKLFVLLQNYIRRKQAEFGFREIHTPQVMNVDLWKMSGHYDNYRENMFFTQVDEQQYAIKPMSCPAHVKVFQSGLRSYRELPLRYSEFGVVHRNELSGTVHGLTRVRRITQDDGHIFCTPEQIQNEMKLALRFVQEAYRDLTFDEVKFYLSTRPEKRVGAEELWDTAENALVEALKSEGIDYILNPGDGAFYGPKIDIKVKDAIGRFHQCATIQLDFQTAGRLGASYVSAGNKPEVPVMIHRAVLGSVERFMGVFIEHTAGHFPIGLAPVQARIVTVKESCVEWGEQVRQQLFAAGVRVDCDFSNDTLSAKVREAQVGKIPYMLVIGDKEVEHRTITPRYRDGKNREAMSPQAFVSLVKEESGVFWGIDVNQH
ncbi:MAG: threonine--tRNA ligase [Silvanigrellaceae bacterium]